MALDGVTSFENGLLQSQINGRDVAVCAPSDTKETPTKWVMALHGSFGSPENFASATHLCDTAKDISENGVPTAIVYANSQGNFWRPRQNQDIDYLKGLSESLNGCVAFGKDEICFDGKPEVLVGHSSGGMMTESVACQEPDLAKAYVSVSGARVRDNCEDSVSMSIFHDENDPAIPFEGGRVFGQNIRNRNETFAQYLRNNDCKNVEVTEGARYTELSGVGCTHAIAANYTQEGCHGWPSGEVLLASQCAPRGTNPNDRIAQLILSSTEATLAPTPTTSPFKESLQPSQTSAASSLSQNNWVSYLTTGIQACIGR